MDIGEYKLMEYENFHGYSSEDVNDTRIGDYMLAEYENFHSKDDDY